MRARDTEKLLRWMRIEWFAMVNPQRLCLIHVVMYQCVDEHVYFVCELIFCTACSRCAAPHCLQFCLFILFALLAFFELLRRHIELYLLNGHIKQWRCAKWLLRCSVNYTKNYAFSGAFWFSKFKWVFNE